MNALIEYQLLGKVVIAAFLGGVVGMEREFAEKPAGLRTHMLAGGVSALLVVLANQMVSSFEQQNLIATDPIRILQAIVVGISFLGAGTILKYNREGARNVEGLATSASLLSVSAIGIAVALDVLILAIGVTVLNVFINWGIMFLIRKAKSNMK
jgi:putative Mg2+ transporter-C (MgtC) family protein